MKAARPLNFRTYSRFARDPDVFLYLVDSVLFTLARQAVNRGESVVRVWSLGCAAGEEPFSIAIAWVCALAAEYPDLRIQIWGTDVDSTSLERARAGVFDSHAVANLPVEWLAKCFEVQVRDSDRKSVYVLSNELRQSVTFAEADAQIDPPPEGGPFSLILCRYSLFLYLPSSSCWKIVQRILAPTVLCQQGYLVTGVTDQMPQGIKSLGLVALACAPNGVYRIDRRGGECCLLDDKPVDPSFDICLPKTLSELLESKRDRLPLKQEPAMHQSFVSSRSRKLLRAHAESGALTIKKEEERPHLPEASLAAKAGLAAKHCPIAKPRLAAKQCHSAKPGLAAKQSDRTGRRPHNRQTAACIAHEVQQGNARTASDECAAVSARNYVKRRSPGVRHKTPVCEIRSRHEECHVPREDFSAGWIPHSDVGKRTAVPLRSQSMSALKHTLSEEETELLIERLMTDVVRRQQRLTSMRANQELVLSSDGSFANKLSRKAVLNFLSRVAVDVEKRKQSLAQLQLDLVGSSVLCPTRNSERRRQEQRGLVGLRCIAERATTTNPIISLAVNPNRLIRFMLRATSLGPVASNQSCSMASANPRAAHVATFKPQSLRDCYTEVKAPRRSIVLSSMPNPRALAMRAPVPDQTSMMKRSLKLGVASVGFATRCR